LKKKTTVYKSNSLAELKFWMKFIIYSSYITVLLPIFDKSIWDHLHIDPSNVFPKDSLTIVTFPNCLPMLQ